MGMVMSMVSRKLRRFNVENRAHRLLEKEKPTPAPKYESNLQDLQRALDLDPHLVDKLNKKDSSLDERLKNVYVTSKDTFITYNIKRESDDQDRSLPLNRNTPEDFEYGYKEPTQVQPGRCTLRQAIKFITDHQGDPDLWTKQRIADEYKLKEDIVEKILRHFKSFSVYVPDRRQRESILTQAKAKFIKGGKQQEEEKPK